jgi:alpha-galactosidase/6-phospho-beta-glucosidase family protein
MNITFIGGGSLRILPIVRSLLDKRELFDGGSIRLVDLQLERAEAVGRMIMRCPEFKNANCQVLWTKNMEEGLTGTDILYVTMAIERQPSLMQSNRLAREYDIWTSDNLSANGAFLAARGASAIMSFARTMEKVCPDALMLIFANPVAVFSSMVNNHTKIKALGICEGFHNHKWDLPHMINGVKTHDDSIDVVAAGVNHLSFILHGTWNGRQIKDILDEHLLSDTWQALKADKTPVSKVTSGCLNLIQRLYKRFGTMVFSSEGDAIAHLFPEEAQNIIPPDCYPGLSAETLQRQAQEELNARYDLFFKAIKSNDDSIWGNKYQGNIMFGKDTHDISNPILDAVGYGKTFRIIASAPNNGAVEGFPDNAALEYTIDIKNKTLSPVANQYVPTPFQGLIASLAESQTILAEAVGNQDPQLFADALESYPIKRFDAARNEYYEKMFSIYSDLPEVYQHAIDFLKY